MELHLPRFGCFQGISPLPFPVILRYLCRFAVIFIIYAFLASYTTFYVLAPIYSFILDLLLIHNF